MKYFLDTEFIEKPCTIDLISLALVAEDGRELYLENSEADLSNLDDWMKRNVIPHLKGDGIPKAEFKDQILKFIGEDKKPEIWGYFADYDWVVFCWLFGRMIDLPLHFPKYCRDLKQVMDTLGVKKSQLPQLKGNAHNALVDARWVADAFFALHGIAGERAGAVGIFPK